MSNKFLQNLHPRLIQPIVIALVVFVGLFIYQWHTSRTLESAKTALELKFIQNEEALKNTQHSQAGEQNKNATLSSTLIDKQQKNSLANGTVEKLQDTLQKMARTDPELLQKYSKVYFLNENYAPAELIVLAQHYLYDP